jgi:hypothetical protein
MDGEYQRQGEQYRSLRNRNLKIKLPTRTICALTYDVDVLVFLGFPYAHMPSMSKERTIERYEV